ncbi:hydroxymethylglutaryl-CoA reductase (NADPH) [Halocatena halophila]|uniref:hydroxymethylglutaryl-CoA reductase (NADPH) n=1 Tax=Halocatena halophila TaxID=2814576 RepID=UPI002ED09365
MTTPSALAERVSAGEIALHELEAQTDPDTAAAARRELLESTTNADLSAVGSFTFDADVVQSAIENMVGAVQIPVGVAGPVAIDGSSASGTSYLPLATTEGALVASINRGCSAIQTAGGANAHVLDSKMTRAPVFRVENVHAASALAEWVDENFDALADAAEATTNHGKLLDIRPYVVGDSVFLRFAYDTKDAMGMNMATIATQAACELIEAETTADLVALSGNLCSDKKPAAINLIEGRGRTVAADVQLTASQVADRFDTTPGAIEEANTRKNLLGSARAGSLGFNAHAANVIAAVFLATGQDPAQVVEGANTITSVDVRDGDLYASVTIASLDVGTVGGGTKLPTQSEGLELLGVAGGGDPAGANADALAEVIATGVLAGELSLLGALASDNLASAHEELGR